MTQTVTPILRIFDVPKAREFYLDFLGFAWDWEHRFSENAPLYAQVSLGGAVLHLSEHHGDASPGAAVRIQVPDAAALQQELLAKNHRFARPGLEKAPWGEQSVTVTDPFHNRLVFFTPDEGGS
nr:glyoxalase superfamily protein [uncultured Roseococcus sp.]